MRVSRWQFLRLGELSNTSLDYTSMSHFKNTRLGAEIWESAYCRQSWDMPRLTSLAVAEQVFSDKNSPLYVTSTVYRAHKQKHPPKVLLQIHKDNQKPALEVL